MALMQMLAVNQIITGYLKGTGTRAPTLGAGGTTWPPAGWTSIQNNNVDDGFLAVPLGFNFIIANTTYTTAYLGSNSYVTFGAGSSNYNSLSASNPAFNKFFFGAADNSYQRVAYITAGSDYTRIRYEGNGSTSGVLGTPGIVAEITFFNISKTNNVPTVELLIGNHNRNTGLFGVATASTFYTSSTITANQSYLLEGNATGTAWTITSGAFMSGTGY